MTQLTPTQAAPTSEPTPGLKGRLQRLLPVLLPVVLVVGATGLGVRYWLSRPEDSSLELSGRIEGYETDLGAKVGGRVASIAVREGNTVDRGQVIARLDDAEVRAQLQAARARVASARQQVTQARLQLDVLASQGVEAELALQQSQGDTVGQVRQSQASVAAAEAQLVEARAQVQQAESALALARADRDRFASLLAQGAIPQQQFDQIQTTFETARDTLAARQAAVAAARQQVAAAQGVLTQAQTSQLNPDIRRAQVERLRTQRQQAQAQLAAAEAALDQAQADYAEIEARLADLEIASPIAGVVVTRMVEPGEVIAAGTPVITVVNLEDVYLRGYIPEGEVGLVRVGQPAQVFLDSAPEQPLEARVAAVDTEASFTPENIYFQEDRVDQVFGLRLGIENPSSFAKPGMPADGTILLEQSGAE